MTIVSYAAMLLFNYLLILSLDMNNKIKVIDLFSGAGGLSEGFRMAGFHVVAAVEKDKWAAKTQQYNHNHWKQNRTVVLNCDITDTANILFLLKSNGVTSADLIIGGPPCQGFSRANVRTRNETNPDNQMFKHYVSIVKSYKPAVAVIENVADLYHFNHGAKLQEILSEFDALGYETQYSVLNAADYGVPQIRHRLFIIASQKGLFVSFPKKKIKEPINYVPLWDAISDLPLLSNGNTVDIMPYQTNQRICPYQKLMRRKTTNLVSNNKVTQNSDLVITRYSYIPQGGNWRDIPDTLMGNYADKERCHHWIYRRLPENKPSVVITNYRKNMLIHPRQNRGLSVREAARIQSFPDDFVFLGGILHQQQQVANAVPPLLAKAVAKSIIKTMSYDKQ